jgi:hypothetical protein
MRFRNIALAVALFLPSCVSSAGPERTGPNTYTVRTHVIGTLDGTAKVAARNAELAAHQCAGTNATVTIIDQRAYGGVAAQDVLAFRCDGGATRAAKAP